MTVHTMTQTLTAADVAKLEELAAREGNHEVGAGREMVPMTANPYTLQPEQISSLSNALTSAAARWREWADELAMPEVAAQFRLQAAEAESMASMFAEATAVMILPPKHLG